MWGDGRDVLKHTVSPLQVAFKIHSPMDRDHLLPFEREQQVTWWILTKQPLETPYCAWAPKAESKQGCFICFNANLLPGHRMCCRPLSSTATASVQHAWPIPRETAMSATGAVPSQQPNPAASNACAHCAQKGFHLPKTTPPPPLPHSRDLAFHLTPAWSHPPSDVPKELEKGTSNDVPPEGSKTEWIRKEMRVTVSKESTSSPLSL